MPPLSKIIWTSLTGSILMVVTLLGSWMQQVNSERQQITMRVTLAEQHYAVIEQQLTDLREDMKDVKRSLAVPPGGGKR